MGRPSMLDDPLMTSVPDQKPLVQAGMAYLGTLHNLKDLFASFDLETLDVQTINACVLAQTQHHETGRDDGTYYDFLSTHILPAEPTALGFCINSSSTTPLSVDQMTADALNGAWKSAISTVLAN